MDQPAIDLNQRIARRIRALRDAHKLSLEALAAKCGVSRSMLSLIERGETSPTAVVLDKIAAAFGIALANMFEDPTAESSPLARAADHAVWRDPQSGYVRRTLSPPNFPSNLQLAEVVLPPGAHITYEAAARDGTIHQQMWMIEGEVEVTVGTATYHLRADDCLAKHLNAPTAFRNPGRKAARYIVAIATGMPRG